jgi:hypothetical protein
MSTISDRLGVLDDPAAEFLRLACLTYGDSDDPQRWAEAAALIAGQPGLRRGNIHVATACADVEEVARLLATDPSLAGVEGGPHRWPPLLYLAHGRHDRTATEGAVLATAKVLLDHGADPNAGYLWHGMPSPFTLLTGAFGNGELGVHRQPAHPHGQALARLFLETGADPNDAQTLYNRMFEPNDDHLELLFEFGLGSGDGGPWRRRLGDAAQSPTAMLLGQLSWAVTHGFTHRISLLADHGVDLDAALDGFGSHGETAHESALTSGQFEAAALLVSLGARASSLTPEEQVLAAVLAADRVSVDRLEAADPDVVARARVRRPGLVVWAAVKPSLDAVRLAVELGWDVSRRARTDVPSDQEWETALHQAAANGELELAELLLALGADPDVHDHRFDATPLGWAQHFEQPELVSLLEPLTQA